MYHRIKFFVPIFVAASFLAGGLWTWSNYLLGILLYPMLDTIKYRPSKERGDELNVANKISYELITLCLHVGLLLLAFYLATFTEANYVEIAGMIVSLATVNGGIGIPMAHELVHQKSKKSRALGLSFLSLVCYMHFRLEHIYGHHKNVGKLSDPTTARYNESFWKFLPRSIIGQIKSSIMIERRLGRSGYRNRLILYLAIQSLIFLVIFIMFNLTALLIFFIQSFLSVFFLEAVNYMEHYGLERVLDFPDFTRQFVVQKNTLLQI